MSSDTTAKRRDASVCATMASLALRPDNARSMSLSASCLGKLPAHNTRAILFRRPAGQPVSPQTPRGSSSDSCARKPITGDFVEVVQSPDTAWTSTPLGDGACAFYYSPTSDTVTIENQGKDPIRIASVRDDGSLTENGIVLRGFAHAKFTPGSWRILSGYDEEDPVVLADLLLFHRRYIVIKEGRVSSTRQNRSNSETLVGRMGADETWRQSAVNPLAGLQKGQSLTIMPDESFACPKKAAGYQRGEVYTLRHTGNITDAKMLATLFGAHHSDLGSTAVKVVRERGAPSWSMPCLADMWRGEEGILRKLDHASLPG